MQATSHGLSNFFGAIAAWLCLAHVAFTREPLSMTSDFAERQTDTFLVREYFAFPLRIFSRQGKNPEN
jgi:hypothetical protein